ncbi:hypothetical protein N9153_02320 [Planctomicrobium sp.]|jgi:hypothetical protein|nr:hypothetical protein [Planctomicrobium sp.]
MRQVKLFKGVEMDLTALEEQVNQWVKKSGVEVQQVTGNIAPQANSNPGQERMSGSDVLIIVEYTK